MRVSKRVAWLVFSLAGLGCGSSPNTTYYTLAAVSGTIRQASLGAVEVRRPSIAGYLDRSEILSQWDGQRLQLANNSAWGEPITAMIGRVLADDLSARLGGTVAFSAASDLSVPAMTMVELVVRKFDLGADGYVHLDVLWSLRGPGSQPVTKSATLKAQPTATSDTGAIVAAMSGLLGQLADEIAAALITRVPAAAESGGQ